jgi:protein SOK2
MVSSCGSFIARLTLTILRIPFERALDFANKEKITESLYPLFVHNIGALLYHPTNQNRAGVVMAAAERRKQEQNSQLRTNQTPGLPSMQPHHHHSMHSSIGGPLPAGQHSLAPHPGMPRPDIQRAHTFPTPPTSSSSVMGNMGSSDNSYQWSGQGMAGQGANPLAIDTGLSNARSMPTTPATTPPGANIQNMQQQYQQGSQGYDSSRQMYSAPPVQQNLYQQSTPTQQSIGRYGSNSYGKNEMGPPTSRAPGSGSDEHHDSKGPNGLLHHGQGSDQVGHGHGDEEAEHEHDGEYTHDTSATYDTGRGPYNYASGSSVGTLSGEHAHLSPEMNGSPNHQAGSGRATPRTTAAPQPYYAQQQGYNTPPRGQPPSSNLYNVMSSERGTANGGTSEVYAPQSDISSTIANGYATQPIINGITGGAKRGRDDEDDGSRPSSRGPGGIADIEGLKRRKTIREGSVPGASYNTALNRPQSAVSSSQRRR